MSWPQWPGAPVQQPPVVAAAAPLLNPAPAVIPPGMPYTSDQWTQMQQQNWQQWAQWQQQYQQWHQQYGAEYQKSINALAAQQVPSVPNIGVASVAPPLPVEPQLQPPLPKDEVPKPAPPLPLPVPAPPPQQSLIPQYSTQPPVPNQFSAPPPAFASNAAQQPWKGSPGGLDQKRPLVGKQDSTAKRQMTSRQGWQNVNANVAQPAQTNQNEELSEAEKKFDKQFAEWESQFNKWKEQNSGHPDKQQYKEYEKKWEQWRQQLLDRREAMRRKRLGLPPAKPGQGQNFNAPPPTQGAQLTTTPQVRAPSKETAPAPSFNKPPPDMNDEPLQFKGDDQEPVPEDGGGLGFLNTTKSDGIPGLDLADVEIIDDEEEEKVMPVQKGPDLDAISKGINNILGDQKLMSMLSMVSQNQSGNLNNFAKVAMDASSSRDHSNMSVEDARNEHPEPIQNFDDLTRSSFTMQPNDAEYYRGPVTGNQFGAPPPNSFDSESPYNRPPPNFVMPTGDDMKKPPPGMFRNEFDKGSMSHQAPTGNDFRRRGTGLLPDPVSQGGFGMQSGRDRDNFGNVGNRGRPDYDQENVNQRPTNRNNFGRSYDDSKTFENEHRFDGDKTPNQNQRFTPGGRDDFNEISPARGGRDDFNRPPPPNNFRKGNRDDFNEPPPPNFRGGNRDDFNEPPPRNFRGGNRDDFNEPPPPNFREGNRDDFNEPPPPNFRGGNRDDFNEPPPPNFRGGRDDFKEHPPSNLRGGRGDFNGPPPSNFRGGRGDFNGPPPPNFRGDRDDFNGPPGPPNFRGGRDDFEGPSKSNFKGGRGDFNGPPPPNFRGGRDDFNGPPPPNFREGRDDFNGPPPPSFRGGRDDFNEQPPQKFGGGRDDFNAPPPPNFRGGRNDFNGPPPPNFNDRGGNLNRSGSGRFGGDMGPGFRQDGFADEDDYPPPPAIDEGFGRNEGSGPMEDAPEPPQFGDGRFDEIPPDDYLEGPAQEDLDIWKPVTVVDYEHKRLKPPEIDVLLQPFRMYDYRHKPLCRIPYPDRPNWLSDAVKMIPEFDPPIIRQPPPPVIDRRMYDDRFDNLGPRRDDRDRYRPDDRHRKGYEPSSRPKYEENDWSSRRRRSRSPPRFERPPTSSDREPWDQGGARPGDRDSRRGGNRKWEEEDRPRRDREYDRERRDDRRERREEDSWRRRDSGWEDKRKWRNDDMDIDDSDRNKKDDERFTSNNRNFERDNFGRKEGVSVFPFSKPIDENKTSSVTPIEDILNAPGRSTRPQRIVIILRGPPGSGKTHLAKMIKDKEVENGGSAPRILSLDDYFMVEQEKEVIEDGRRVKLKEMVYEFEAEMEDSYRNSLIKSFKKTITDGYFPFIIVDNVNDKVKYFGEMWSFAKQNGFQVYICQMELDIQNCTKRNTHNRTEEEIRKCIEGWETTPSHHPVLDATSLLQGEPISEVEMEEIGSPLSDAYDQEDGLEDQLDRSKWDNFDCSLNNLARLDGVSKPPRPSRTMEEFLQLDDEWEVTRPTKPGQKRVRWADLEERKQQEKMRAIGFVVGQTDWDRMMDPSMGQSALTQTKYIEKVQRRRF